MCFNKSQPHEFNRCMILAIINNQSHKFWQTTANILSLTGQRSLKVEMLCNFLPLPFQTSFFKWGHYRAIPHPTPFKAQCTSLNRLSYPVRAQISTPRCSYHSSISTLVRKKLSNYRQMLVRRGSSDKMHI